MKKILLLVPLLFLSCKPDYKIVKTVEIKFENGDVDTFQNPYTKYNVIWDGTHRKIDSKTVLKIDTIKNK